MDASAGHGSHMGIERAIEDSLPIDNANREWTQEKIVSRISCRSEGEFSIRTIRDLLKNDHKPKDKTEAALSAFWISSEYAALPLSPLVRLSEIKGAYRFRDFTEKVKSASYGKVPLSASVERNLSDFLLDISQLAEPRHIDGQPTIEAYFAAARNGIRYGSLAWDVAQLLKLNRKPIGIWHDPDQLENVVGTAFSRSYNLAVAGYEKCQLARRAPLKMDEEGNRKSAGLQFTQFLFAADAGVASEQIVSLSIIQNNEVNVDEWRDILSEHIPKLKEVCRLICSRATEHAAFRMRHNVLSCTVAALHPIKEILDCARLLRQAAAHNDEEKLKKSLDIICNGPTGKEYLMRCGHDLRTEIRNVLL